MCSSLILACVFLVSDHEKPKKVEAEKIFVEPGIGDITGYYVCEGYQHNGERYKGTAKIIKKKDVYILEWEIGKGVSFVGFGIRQGNNLAIRWSSLNKDGKLFRGVNIYKIEPGPILNGTWVSIPGPGMVNVETLTFLKGIDDE